jgi:hypothetical protein
MPADAGQQFVEVILLPLARRILEPLVVHREPFHQILAQAGRGPLAELGAAMAADAITNSEDGFEIVVFNIPRHLPISLLPNHPEFPDGCLPAQLALIEDIDQVFVDGSHVLLKQLRYQCLRKPKGFVFEVALDTGVSVLGLVEDEFGTRCGLVAHAVISLSRARISVSRVLIPASMASSCSAKVSPKMMFFTFPP